MPDTPLDLSKLALQRGPSPGESTNTRRQPRRWLLRYALPIGILLGFLSLLLASAGRQWLPQQAVTVVPVIVQRGEIQQAGTALFQAAGWIEPRPSAISVAALAPGVIESLLVVEGQQVAKDEPIARLIAIDAELAVEQAEATLAIRNGELRRAEAERDAAMIRVEQPVHLQVALAEARSVLAKAKTQRDALPFLIEAAEAERKFTADSVAGKTAARNAIAGIVLQRAQSEHAQADATLRELRDRQPNLEREIDAVQSKVDALETQLKLLVEERRQLEEAHAKVESATALRDEAASLLRAAKLNLKRTVVTAPIAGRVLRVIASPGTRVMGLEHNSRQSSSTVIEMYDPARLQVRADVRLDDVPMVVPGQSVEIETASATGTLNGRVLQSTSVANIQKNTLEVKVELIDPPSNVSPEMLVTATFLAPELPKSLSEPTETVRIMIPQTLVQTGETGPFVWIVDSSGLAQRRPIKAGKNSEEGLVEVLEGLQVTDKVIASGIENLQPGDGVKVSGEEQSLGR
ncbi:biotin/lipoyl-binding protein [Rosistilla oblonga]|uniref:HlyD family efflux transporter periplasmic adaptor subunit n=1 Tax=Rosistilla oblonga TaxID=2527990 RepID=UPI003A96A360